MNASPTNAGQGMNTVELEILRRLWDEHNGPMSIRLREAFDAFHKQVLSMMPEDHTSPDATTNAEVLDLEESVSV